MPVPPPGPIVFVGAPTALGGHLAGMERTPVELRRSLDGAALAIAGRADGGAS